MLLAVVFALSMTAFAAAVSGHGVGGDDIALAGHGHGRGNGNGNAYGHDRGDDSAGDAVSDDDDSDEAVAPSDDGQQEEAPDDEGDAADDGSGVAATPEPAAPEGDDASDPAGDPAAPEPVGGESAAAAEPVAGQDADAQSGDDEPADAPVDSATSASLSFTVSSIPPSGQGVTPYLVEHDNPACPVGTSGYKIDDTPTNGTIDLGGGKSITISNATDYSFDYTTTGINVLEVIVKASDDANIYDYSSLGGVAWDSGLWSVAKPTGGYYQISHVSFCYEELPPTYEISGMKWEDVNGDGLYFVAPEGDPRHEPLLAGWTIELYVPGDAPDTWVLYDSTTTGPDGHYSFTGLPAGTYKVEEVQQSGWVKTYGGCEFTLGGESASLTLAGCHDEEPGCFDFGNMRLEEETYTKRFSLDADVLAAFGDVEYYVRFDLDGSPSELKLSDASPHVAELHDLPDGTTIENVTWWAKAGGEWFLLGEGAEYEQIDGEDLTNEYDYDSYIEGYKFHDLDADGEWGEGEEGLEGWVIELYMKRGDSWSKIAQTSTGSDGHYSFQGLLPGEYYVVEQMQSGWEQTAGCTGPEDSFVIGPGGAVLPRDGGQECGFDFGNTSQPIELYGYKFFDVDGDGAWDGDEDPLAGWTIELYRDQDGWVLVDTTTTAGDGYYEFTGLEPGDYYVVEVIPEGSEWYQTYGPTGSADAFGLGWGDSRRVDFGNTHDYTKTWELTLTSDHVTPPGVSYYVTYSVDGEPRTTDLELVPGSGGPMVYTADVDVAWGQEIADVEWWASWEGEEIKLGDGVDSETVTGDLTNAFRFEPIVFGSKFFDIDADGAWDDGEPGLGGWEIVLVRKMADGSQVEYERTTTDEDGHYEFQAVLPGEYFVYEVEQDGWVQTAGFDGTFFVENYDEEGPFDFGNTQPGSIYGHKYLDFAPTGVLGDEDLPLPDWTIELYRDTGDGWVLVDTAQTGADGMFSFDDLLPGYYYLVEVNQDGWTQTAGPVGPGDSVFLAPGGELGPVDFLNTPPFEPLSPIIFGHKYRDSDGDGKHDADEPGLEGWEINLYFKGEGGWALVDTTKTDAEGYFEFRALPDGSALPDGWYYITETIPEGSDWTQTFGPTGPEDAFYVDDAVEVDYGPFDFGNHLEGLPEELPFLPFTGGSAGPVVALALLALVGGGLLRRRGRGPAQG
ncbi:MAG: hypothetical protein Kow0056_10760 [Coriobacteriia bacterium]